MAASLGLAGLGHDGDRETSLLAALASETDGGVRAVMVRDLGRIGGEASPPALTTALAADLPAERAGACHAVSAMGVDHVTVPRELIERVAARAGDDVDRAVRLACAHAVLRSPPTAGVYEPLVRMAADADPELRAMAVRALGHGPDAPLAALEGLLGDPDPTVVLQTFRALGARADADRALGQGLRSLVTATLADLDAPRVLPTLLGALEAVSVPVARTMAVHTAAGELLEMVSPRDPDRARVHCALARLVDLGRGWPGRVERCGGEHVSAERRAVLALDVAGAVEGAERERTAYVARHVSAEAASVRAAAAQALGAMDHVDGRAALLTLAADADDGVAITALDALTRRFERAITARDATELASLLGAPVTPSDGWPDETVVPVLRAAAARFREHDDLEGLVTLLGALTALRATSTADLALGLALHHDLAVRDAARAVLEALGTAPPEGDFASPPNPIAATALTGPEPVRITLTTSRGVVTVELRPDWAPTTVARIVGLVRARFYDGLTFHRVVPGFVVQGGDPRGDGFGGPGWSQRCEDNRIAYERGIVGMALAGRDTGGSQFFITLTPQPHLDGRYTAFGRVTEGMEVVERLVAGDTILSVTVVGP